MSFIESMRLKNGNLRLFWQQNFMKLQFHEFFAITKNLNNNFYAKLVKLHNLG